MKPEQKFWQYLKPHIPGFATRLESPMSSGVPDVVIMNKGKTTWLELKVMSDSGRTILRKEQWAWGSRVALENGDVWVASLMGETTCLWLFGYFDIKPVGTQGKYVEIVNPSIYSLDKHSVKFGGLNVIFNIS